METELENAESPCAMCWTVSPSTWALWAIQFRFATAGDLHGPGILSPLVGYSKAEAWASGWVLSSLLPVCKGSPAQPR